MLCRDHSGPYMGNNESHLSEKDALVRSLESIYADIAAGFDIIHIDCSACKGDVYEATDYLLRRAQEYAVSLNRKIIFEVGTEENCGEASDLKKFESDLQFILDIVQPEFVVGQTGSLVKEMEQVGSFRVKHVEEMVRIAHVYGVKFKEHNADYIQAHELKMRADAGVDAINIAPQLGVLQTKTVVDAAKEVNAGEVLRHFLQRSLRSNKWEKWIYQQPSDYEKSLIAGHYIYASDEYQSLIDHVRKRIDIDKRIHNAIRTVLDYYIRGFICGSLSHQPESVHV